MAELVAYAKANPGKLSYGSAGSGSLPHLATELFKAQTGTDMVHVPYKGGGPMVTDLLGGSVQVVIADQANLMPHVQAGKLRALAVATPKRSPNAPDLPTIAETRRRGLRRDRVAGPRRTRRHAARRRRRLNDAFNKVMAMPAVREKLVGGGLDPVGGTPERVRPLHRQRDRQVDEDREGRRREGGVNAGRARTSRIAEADVRRTGAACAARPRPIASWPDAGAWRPAWQPAP